MARITRLADLTGIATPASAPGTLRFSSLMISQFQQLRMASFPGGESMERGGTIVADTDGHLHLQNLGGLGSTTDSFDPNVTIRDPAKYSLVGVFHTHPYGRSEGSMTGVSFSGGDFAYISQTGQLLAVTQSGPRLFAMVRTGATPSNIPETRHEDQENEMAVRQATGTTFQQASRIEAQQTAHQFGIAYYQGRAGVVTRV